MYTVEFWCTANPRRPFWRWAADAELEAAAEIAGRIVSSGRPARIVDAQGREVWTSAQAA